MSSTLQLQLEPKIKDVWSHACYSPPDVDAAGNVQNDFDERATNKEGYAAYGLVDPKPVYVLLDLEGYKIADGSELKFSDTALGPISMPHDALITVQLERAGANAGTPRLHRDGNDLRNPNGQIVRLEGASFFAGHWLLLEKGADAIRPSLRELKSRWNANCALIFGMSLYVQKNLFNADPFNPAKYDQARLRDSFAELFGVLAEEGFYGYYPVFPDHGLLPEFDSDDKCARYWDWLMSFMPQFDNLLLKPTNEGASKGYNYIDPHKLAFPDFCPVAACDYGVDDPAYAAGDYPAGHDWGGDRTFGDLHTPREKGAASVVLDCTAVNNIYYKHNRGLAISEPVRMGSNGSDGATRELARLVGLASRVGNLMRVFHSLQGEKCEVFDDTTRDHADAYFTGV